jgi:hypothetical protein
MSGPELELKSAGSPGTSVTADLVETRGSTVLVRWSRFMLAVPQPAERTEDLADIEAGRRSLAEPGASIPYEDVRRELGLA